MGAVYQMPKFFQICYAQYGNKVAFKDFQNFQETEFYSKYITIFRFFLIFHFGRNGVKFHKSLLLKSHTCTQHIGDRNFQKKPLLQLLASICCNDIIKKFIWLNWVRFIKWVNFSKFSQSPISL